MNGVLIVLGIAYAVLWIPSSIACYYTARQFHMDCGLEWSGWIIWIVTMYSLLGPLGLFAVCAANAVQNDCREEAAK